MSTIASLLFNGIAYGVLLFIMSVGLSVTLGMMHFVNLAQASLSMLGGYVTVTLMSAAGWPFLGTLPAAFVVTALATLLLERVVFRHFYDADELTQVLLTIGIVFMSVASVSYVWGPAYKPITMPPWLVGRTEVAGLELERYRVFLVLVGLALGTLLVLGLERTRFGATVRACVDSRRAAAGCGLHTARIFAITFAIGGGLAGLGGALSANLLGLDPNFPLRYLVYLLIVVSVGGKGSIAGTMIAALAIGVADVAGKYYVPQIGGLAIYLVTIVVMLWRPQGLLGRAA